MEYIIEHDKIQVHNLIFKLPIKNQNENYINFYKILFSNKYITLKYILIKLNFTSFTIKQDSYRYKVVVNKGDDFIKNIGRDYSYSTSRYHRYRRVYSTYLSTNISLKNNVLVGTLALYTHRDCS